MRYGMRPLLTLCLALFTLGCAGTVATEAPSPAPNVKRVALSFDDAPRGDGPRFTGRERTHVLLQALAHATPQPVVMFATTRGFDQHEDGRARLERYAAAGHLIANHSHSHMWAHKTDAPIYLADIDRASAALQGMDNLRPWFRFPFLDEARTREKRDALRIGLKQRRLMNGYVTIDTYDWYIEGAWQRAVNEGRAVNMGALRKAYVEMIMTASRFYARVAEDALERQPAHVVLLHENDLAASFIGDLIAAYEAEGWEIISPDEAYADAIATREPDTLRTSQGRVAALAIDRGRDPRTLTHLGIEEDRIDALLERLGVFAPMP